MPSQSDSLPTQTRLCILGEADPFLARLLQRFVEKSGLRASRAQTGEALLAQVEREQPALVLLDPELPGKVRGWEAYRQIRTHNAARPIPIIICTWLSRDQAQTLLGESAVLLQKPDLFYETFAAALHQAGISITPDEPKRV